MLVASALLAAPMARAQDSLLHAGVVVRITLDSARGDTILARLRASDSARLYLAALPSEASPALGMAEPDGARAGLQDSVGLALPWARLHVMSIRRPADQPVEVTDSVLTRDPGAIVGRTVLGVLAGAVSGSMVGTMLATGSCAKTMSGLGCSIVHFLVGGVVGGVAGGVIVGNSAPMRWRRRAPTDEERTWLPVAEPRARLHGMGVGGA